MSPEGKSVNRRKLAAWTLVALGIVAIVVTVRICYIFVFGYLPPGIPRRWDGMKSPDIRDAGALLSVSNFIASHGGNMQTNGWVFEDDRIAPKPISGLPWKSIKALELPALTQNDILYVRFGGWHHDSYGVAWNPKRKKFSSSVKFFKPIGDHWYVWLQPEFQSNSGPQQYE